MSGDDGCHRIFLGDIDDVLDTDPADAFKLVFQWYPVVLGHEQSAESLHSPRGKFTVKRDRRGGLGPNSFKIVLAAVSYTHLTLPTKRIV